MGPFAATSYTANTFTAGDTLVLYKSVGLPGLSPNYLLKSPVCTDTVYFCGKETISLVTAGAETVKRGSKSGGTYLMTEVAIDALFAIDTTPADAYAGCNIITYELVQSDLTTAYTDTSIVSYTQWTGLTWIIANVVAN